MNQIVLNVIDLRMAGEVLARLWCQICIQE